MAQRFSSTSHMSTRGNSSGVPRSLIVLVVVSLAIFVLGIREGEVGPIHGVRSVFQTITTPVRVIGSAISSPISGISNVVGNLTADSDTLTELKNQNAELQAEVARLSEYEQQADTLTSLLELRNTYNLVSCAASVIAHSTDRWSSTITIDKGTSSGIDVGMPVSSASGIIGQVSEVSFTTATVRLITDENSGVSAMDQASRAQGQLVGSADGTLRLTLVRTDQNIAVGDMVITSGLGGVYPRGLPLGTISNITKSSGAMYYEVTVEPLSSMTSLESVLVITSLTDEQQATEEDIAAANTADLTTATDADTQESAATDSSEDTQAE